MHTIVCQVLEQVKQVILWVLISSFYSPLLKSFGWGVISTAPSSWFEQTPRLESDKGKHQHLQAYRSHS